MAGRPCAGVNGPAKAWELEQSPRAKCCRRRRRCERGAVRVAVHGWWWLLLLLTYIPRRKALGRRQREAIVQRERGLGEREQRQGGAGQT
eukprot:4930221-Prymnesium_polylepis.1